MAESAAPPGLLVSGLSHAYGGAPVLRDASLVVPDGALAAVLGPSGCGKTTLLRLVAGFERPVAGSIVVGGELVTGPAVHLPPERRRVGLVPQEGALFPHLSVAENVGFGLDRAQRRGGRVREVLALVGLADLGDRMPYELSGGQQQRVAVARALAPRPALVLLDEPFSALDAALRAELRSDVRAAVRADGTTAVLVTHDQQEALSTADLVAVLRHGRVAQAGSPWHVYREPVDLGVARFVGEAVVLDGTVRAGLAVTVLGALAVAGPLPADGERVDVLLRPEQLALGVAAGPGGGEHRGTPERPSGAHGLVAAVEFQGADSVVSVELHPGAESLLVTVRERWADRRSGDPVQIRVTGPARVYPHG